MADRHIDDLADLYALGALSEIEAARVEAHVAACEACLRRVGEAEETVLALERGYAAQTPLDELGRGLRFDERPRTPAWRFAAAAAAGLIVGLGVMLPQTLHHDRSQQAIDAMIHSHFAHAPFTGGAPDAPAAKVIYAHGRSWLYVLASGRHDYEVDAVRASGRESLGTLHVDGDVSTLFVDRPVDAAEIDLIDRGTVVERARLP